MIKKLTKDLPKIQNVSNKIIAKISIVDWKKKRHLYDEKIYAKEISTEYLGKNSNTQQVYDAPRVLDKKLKKLFG